jgi:predicted ATPase
VSGDDGFVFTSEKLMFRGDEGKDISSSDRESRLKITDNFRAKYIIKQLNGFRKYHFHDTSSKSPFTKMSHIEMAMTVLFMQPKLPDTIFIDEPELGLHPAAIAKLAGMIKSAAAKGCQVIMATQSTDLISHFLPADIITVDQIDGESKFKRLDFEELRIWLDDFTIDDLWKRNIITTGQLNY